MSNYDGYAVLYDGKYGKVLQKWLGDRNYELVVNCNGETGTFASSYCFKRAWINHAGNVFVGGVHSALYTVSRKNGFEEYLPYQTYMYHDNGDMCVFQEMNGPTYVWSYRHNDLIPIDYVKRTTQNVVIIDEYAYATASNKYNDLVIIKIDYDNGGVVGSIQVNRYQKDKDGKPDNSLVCGYGLKLRDGKLYFTNEYRGKDRKVGEFFMEIDTDDIFKVLNTGVDLYSYGFII